MCLLRNYCIQWCLFSNLSFQEDFEHFIHQFLQTLSMKLNSCWPESVSNPTLASGMSFTSSITPTPVAFRNFQG